MLNRLRFSRKMIWLLGWLMGGLLLALVVQQSLAAYAPRPAAQVSPLHPTFALLDENGQSVLETSGAVSTVQTCGQCHDSAFIQQHSFHADLGLSDFTAPGQTASGRAWDASPGLFGKWNPLTYRMLSAAGDERIDLTTADWIRLFAERVVGGGPAVTSRTGQPLAASTETLDVTATDFTTGQTQTWDWAKSGVVEMNCFVCHLNTPNNAARVEAIRNGDFRWAATATLLGTGLVEQTDSGWAWNTAAFDENGELTRPFVTLQDPTNTNCAQCHGVVHTDPNTPLVVVSADLNQWQTATTGQVLSAQKISESGLNLTDKDSLTRAWDIHLERGLNCTDCHYSLNNPALAQTSAKDQPEHLTFDPRRLEIGEYLQKPDHQLARGQSAQYTLAPELKGTMRRCEGCHATDATHSWLPYTQRHMAGVACETCHIPQLYAPTVQAVDWTVLTTAGQPRTEYRGIEGDTGTLADLVTGYQPVLLPREDIDGQTMLAPYNLITAYYWVYTDANGNDRPVRLADLQAAWLVNGQYVPELLVTLDVDRDGQLNPTELALDTPEKQRMVAERLQMLGLSSPRIVGEIQPYSLNHNVARGEWATRDCQVCHSDASLVTRPITLSNTGPAGITPAFVQDANTFTDGDIQNNAGAGGGGLAFTPAPSMLYVFGHSRVGWVDWFGAAAFVGVLLAVSGHGGLRFYAALRQRSHHQPALKRVYMYAVYERFWHWLQTFTIVLLLFTGLIIHRPDVFSLFGFPQVVLVHNVLAAILVLNAALSLFYHLVSGEIRQYIPRPYGFFDQAIEQSKFYLKGIFSGAPHPFEKTPQKKLNPLQQLTYFGILNVLLPLQVLTGALMWGVQAFPQIANLFGGLPFLAPFHSLIAWLFAAFIVAHVYLTTTAGHEPLSGIKAMMLGWDEVDDPAASTETSDHDHPRPIQTPTPAP